MALQASCLTACLTLYVAGYQVAPAELEAIIGSMKSVKDVVVIPVLNDEAGELPRYCTPYRSTPPSYPPSTCPHLLGVSRDLYICAEGLCGQAR